MADLFLISCEEGKIMETELLEIHPCELKFIFELKKQSCCSVRLVNKSNHDVAFKVKTTSPKRYCVRPSTGIVKPKSSWEFTVTMQAHLLAPDMECADKFLIESTVVPVGTTDEDITRSMFAKDDGRKIVENKLKVILIRAPSSPELPPISGTLVQGTANEASILKDQVLSGVEIISPNCIVKKTMATELLEIHPGELKFIFELKKQSCCSVRLVNKSNHDVAFKVKTTFVERYCVQPNTGIVKPKSSREFTVTMQAHLLAPDMECADKFLIESTVVPVGTTDEDITRSMFAKDGGRKIVENKLKVILIRAPSCPELSPISGTLVQGTANEASILKDQVLSGVEIISPNCIVKKTMATELLEIHPGELKFIFELKKQSCCSVRLVNKSNHDVAFKVKTTFVERYCVRPNTGIVKPKSSREFTVTMQAHLLAPDMDCADKFLIESTVVPVGTTDEDITRSMFAKDDGRKIVENKLKVILIRAPSSPELSPISGTLVQGTANEASILKDQVLSGVEIISPNCIVRKTMATELLEIRPRELKFIFELKKQSYCSVRLVNKSNHYVAFKVKTMFRQRYCVRPNTGIVKPKSSRKFTVTMQAHRFAPDMDCKDEFLIVSTVVPVGTTYEDITPSMFSKDDGRKTVENKLKVILISAQSSQRSIYGRMKHLLHISSCCTF